MKPRVIVFAKDPQPGRVKTRLAKTIGPEQAARIYGAMVFDLHAMLMRLTHRMDIEFHLDTHSDFFEGLPVRKRLQQGGDLGQRILHALEQGLREGAPRVTILGSDSPTLTPEAVEKLMDDPADLAFGPAPDGGFWGVTARRIHPAMFQGARWSNPETLRDCAEEAARCGLTIGRGPECADVDEAFDLLALDPDQVGDQLRELLRELVPPDGVTTSP